MKDPNGEYTESSDVPSLTKMLLRLQLPFLREHHHELAQTAAEQRFQSSGLPGALIEGEVNRREDSGLQRRIRLARFPVLKTLDQFDWSWPKKSIARKSRICSGYSSSNKKPTPSC